MKIIKYALLHKKSNTLVGFYTTSNSGEFCTDVEYNLVYDEENIWVVDSFEKAEYVRNNSTDWYNANYNTPQHSYHSNELSVVKLEIEVIQ